MTENNMNADTLDSEKSKRRRILGAAFLGLVGGASALFGFTRTVGKAKKSETKIIEKGGRGAVLLLDEGSMLALRALGWGSLYAVAGTGAFCFGVWKLSGAKNFEEFRYNMGKNLPKLTNDEPQNSRTEFEGLNDLMKYLAVWSKEVLLDADFKAVELY